MFQIIFLVVSFLVQELLKPTPKFPKPPRYSEGEFTFPTSDESVSQKILFGTARIFGNVIAKGDYRAEEVKKKVRVSLFKKAKQTIGWKYYLGFWMSLTGLPLNSVKKIMWGDRVAWSGDVTLSKTAVTDISVNLSYRADGAEVSDGLAGTFRFYNQEVRVNEDNSPLSYTQIPNSYMASILGKPVPAYPNRCHVVFLGPSGAAGSGFIGTDNQLDALAIVAYAEPQVKPILGATHSSQWSFRTISYPVEGSLLDSDVIEAVSTFVDNTMSIGTGDVNPVYCILTLMCTNQIKLSKPISPFAVDIESFMRAAQKIKDEGIGVSTLLEGAETKSVREYLKQLFLIINGGIYIDPRTGLIALKLIREDDEVEKVFDSDNIIDITSFSRIVTADAVNEVTVPFVDKSNLFVERLATIQSPALIKTSGTVNALRKEFKGIADANVASILASRTMRTVASPLATIEFQATRELGEVLQEGALIHVTHPKIGNTIRYRITGYKYAGNKATITAVQDIFKSGYPFAVPVITDPSSTVNPPAVSLAVVEVAPYGMHGNDFDVPVYWVEAGNKFILSAQPAYLENTTLWDNAKDPDYIDVIQPAITGTLTAALASNGASISVLLSDDAIEVFNKSQKDSRMLLRIGTEYLQTTAYSLNTTTKTMICPVRRGLFDTYPLYGAVGTKVTILLGYAVDETAQLYTMQNTSSSSALAGLASIIYRAEIKSADSIIQVNDATTTQASLTASTSGRAGRALRPISPSNVQVNGAFGRTSLLETQVNRSRGALTLAWNNRSRADINNDYFSSTNIADAGVSVEYVLDWETTPGSGTFTSNSMSTATAGASSVALVVSGIPAGERKIRVGVRATKTLAGGVCNSDIVQYYWNLLA